jgi:hypothetical protein
VPLAVEEGEKLLLVGNICSAERWQKIVDKTGNCIEKLLCFQQYCS